MQKQAKIMFSCLLVAAVSIPGASVLASKSNVAEYRSYLEKHIEEKLEVAYDRAAAVFRFDDSDYQLFRADSLDRPEEMSTDDYTFLRLTMGETIFQTNEIEKGDFAPAIYIKNSLDEAGVLLKKQNGENKKFTYQKDDTAKLRWKLVEQEAADGEAVKVSAPQSFDAFVQEKLQINCQKVGYASSETDFLSV